MEHRSRPAEQRRMSRRTQAVVRPCLSASVCFVTRRASSVYMQSRTRREEPPPPVGDDASPYPACRPCVRSARRRPAARLGPSYMAWESGQRGRSVVLQVTPSDPTSARPAYPGQRIRHCEVIRGHPWSLA
ncbi:hypothetical protein E2C01_039347 [Portunus trituberculatus]|uniref:Uncharacterized protein n=1 Tax=Portunus trituberculatus TaxID=210409 RepID=A0A5B7FEI3_PORTR|nr:hypothetical protein [Portunus trituberculatus]